MPAPLSDIQRHNVLRLLLEGQSYGETASETGFSKSTVSGVWRDFSRGQMPGFDHLADYADALREAAIELRQAGVSPGEAILGLGALRSVARVGLEPSRLEEYAQLCERLGEETQGPETVRAALELQRLEAATGMGYEALSDRTKELDERRRSLEVEVADLEVRREEIQAVQREEMELREEMDHLNTQRNSLRKDIEQRQRREQHLGGRVEDLEARVADADERLAVARKATEDLATMGLLPEDLPGFAQRLGAVADRHHWKPGELRERLLAELEMLDVSLTLEAGKPELDQLEAEKVRLWSTLSRLRKEQKRLEALLLTLRDQACADVRRAGQQIAASTRQAAERLRSQQEELLQKTLGLAENLGRLEAELRSHEWLEPLLALVLGREELAPEKVRSLALILLKSLHTWLDKNRETSLAGARWSIEGLIRSFEGWKA